MFPGYGGQTAGWHAHMAFDGRPYISSKQLVWRLKFEALFPFFKKNIIDETSRVVGQSSRRRVSWEGSLLFFHVCGTFAAIYPTPRRMGIAATLPLPLRQPPRT